MDLRLHQKKCIKEIEKHFNTENSALIKMFCGSGKSFVIYDLLFRYGKQLSVVVVPSINLITQFNKDYLLNKDKQKYNEKYFNKNYELLTICSKNELDKTTKVKFTTDEQEITEFLEKEQFKIIIVTYQSLKLLFNVIKDNQYIIDIICWDEAHHILGDGMKQILFGLDEEDYNNDNELIENDKEEYEDEEQSDYDEIENFVNTYITKSLYFTATPKNSNGIKMYEPVVDITINNDDFEK